MQKTNNKLTVTFTNIPDGIIEGIKKICDDDDKNVVGVKVITSPETDTFSIDTRFMDSEERAKILAGIFSEYARAAMTENLFKKHSINI